jgi:DeoR family ulaG and ulaABCDEF operon transcriptional repressor
MRLAEHIRDMEIDVLTNSFPIASHLFSKGRARITLPGGTLYPEQNIILSPFEDDAVQHFWASKLFTGAFGISRVGLMEADPLIVHATRKLLRQAERIVVLADSSKLRRQSAILVTDSGATEAMLEPFRDAGVEVVLADWDPNADKDFSEVA